MATTAQKPALVLDTKGLLCPNPVVKTSQAIKQIKVGEILEILATDAGSTPDITAWAKMTGNELLDAFEQKGEPVVYTFHIRRTK